MLTDPEILRRQVLPSFRLTPQTDWRVLLRMRANVMVTGPEEALTAFALAARPELREPVKSVACSAPLFLEAHTILLGEIHALDGTEQGRLMRWVDEPRNADIQFITLTSVPLFPLVSSNCFDAELFYRLNTIHLEIQAA